MKKTLSNIALIFKPLFFVDSRSLGIYRMLLGVLCFIDIFRRWSFIDIFYTNDSIISISTSNSYYKTFTLLTTFTKSWEVHLFFLVGLIFSIFIIIGFKTRLSQVISTIVIISIHNRAIMLENAGDLFFNNLLILSLFLPLGISFSIDSLRKSLKHRENTPNDLNEFNPSHNKPKEIFSIGFFAILIQLSCIYFFTGINKSGYDWSNGSAVFKMFQLDTFLTPIGYFLREYISFNVSKFFTYTTLSLELLTPLLLLIPFYSYILRSIFILCYMVFHISIRLSVKVGLFSFTMITTYILLFDKRILDKLKKLLQKRFYNNSYILFYDTDCGFCHFVCRVIKRFDVFNQIIYADTSYRGDKPQNLDDLSNKTVVLYNQESKNIWIKQKAFGKILSLLPLGFFISWIFFIPYINKFFEIIYDLFASNRAAISKFFGLSACDIKNKKISAINVVDDKSRYHKLYKFSLQIINLVIVSILIIACIKYNLVANKAVNEYMTDYGYEKFTYNKTLKRISTYPRIIQRWNMFAPTVLATDKTIIVEATLSNGEVVDPFTGKPPILNSVDYTVLWHDHNQFWRKFFSRVSKKQNTKYVTSFEKWIKKRNNTYFDDILDGQKIKSVKIWSLSQRNKSIKSKKENKVNKRLLNKTSNSNNKTPNKKPPTKKI